MAASNLREQGTDALAKIAERDNGDETSCLAAARALAVRGDAVAEPALVAALEKAWPSVREAAAGALGAIGSAAAVPALRAAAENGDAAVQRAAKQAIAEIQSRLPGADRGQLSLADAGVGKLTLTHETPRGHVSLAERE